MNRSIFTIGAVIALAGLIGIPEPASAQLGQLRGLIPGARPSNAASVDPDAFLAETIETTKFMMVAAAVLAQAEATDVNRDALRAEIAAIQGITDIGELNARRASFTTNTEAAALNYRDAAATQAAYDSASSEQQQLLLSAAFNFTLGMARNVQLAQQAPQLLQSMQSNPMLLMKIGSIRTAGGLLAQQAQAARSMGGMLRTIMSQGGVEVPADAHAAEPRPVEL